MTVPVLLQYGAVLIIIAGLALLFGINASINASINATAASGFARNLRMDIFKSVQNFSFENIDRFSNASLVTHKMICINRGAHAQSSLTSKPPISEYGLFRTASNIFLS